MLDPLSLPDEIPVGEASKYLGQLSTQDDVSAPSEIPNEIPISQVSRYLPYIRKMARSGASASGASSGYANSSAGVTTGFGRQVKPSSLPLDGRISQEYGVPVNYEKSGFHGGVDIALPEGTAIPDPVGGEVIGVESKNTGYGKSIIVRGEDGITRRYSHLSAFKAGVGDKIKAGQVIGLVGSTGKSTGNHLDYREYQ